MMKRLTLIMVMAFIVSAGSYIAAPAQVPTIGVYFDSNLLQQTATCPGVPVGTHIDTWYVVVENVNSWISAIEFSINYSSKVAWLSDNHLPSSLAIGTSPSSGGVAISFGPIPQNAFNKLVVMEATVLWMCKDCGGGTAAVSPRKTKQTEFRRAVGWPDNNIIDLVETYSLICSGALPVEQQTWGAIKALYR